MKDHSKSEPLIYFVFGTAIFAFGMGMFYAIAAFAGPSVGLASLPASLAFNFIGFLGSMTGLTLQALDKRVRALERATQD